MQTFIHVSKSSHYDWYVIKINIRRPSVEDLFQTQFILSLN
jgi:hypothetical protein